MGLSFTKVIWGCVIISSKKGYPKPLPILRLCNFGEFLIKSTFFMHVPNSRSTLNNIWMGAKPLKSNFPEFFSLFKQWGATSICLFALCNYISNLRAFITLFNALVIHLKCFFLHWINGTFVALWQTSLLKIVW